MADKKGRGVESTGKKADQKNRPVGVTGKKVEKAAKRRREEVVALERRVAKAKGLEAKRVGQLNQARTSLRDLEARLARAVAASSAAGSPPPIAAAGEG